MKKSKPLRITLAVDISEANAWHYGIYRGVQRYLSEVENVELVIEDFPHTNDRNLPDGLIGRADYAMAKWAEDKKIPFINVSANSPIAQDVPTFAPDTSAGTRLAAEHLFERGFRRFCLMDISDEWRTPRVEESFRSFAEERNCVLEVIRLARLFTKSEQDWKHFINEVPKSWKEIGSPFGLLTSPDCITFTGRCAADLCTTRGLRIPLDVAIVDGQNGEPYCKESPSLTAIDWNYENVGFEAAKALHASIENGQVLESRWLPPAGLIERDSTDIFATEDEVVTKAMTFISANFSSPLRVDDIAEGIFVTRRTLERRFKTVTGRSISAEIMRLRVSKAKRMMSTGELDSLKGIAREVGFSNERRLYDAFRSLEGCSPSEYRGRIKRQN